MRTVTILVIFLAQWTYLLAKPEPNFKDDIGDFLHSDSCIFGIKSVSMSLFNSRNPEGKNIGVEESCDDVDPSQPVVFIVHGFISSANTSRTQELASRLVQKGNTVFALDWSQGACTNGIPIAKFLAYPSAVENTREVGKFMARYVSSLIKECNVPLKKIKFIGHSLGAHVCGFAAKTIQEELAHNIPLIVAADPAAPMFSNKDCKEKLCHSDAKRLVVLHTSFLGFRTSIGDFDLWFNKGKMQPGCGINIACSHTRSIEYIIDLMKDDCVYLGVPMDAPSPPGPETKDCIVVNSNILDSDNPMKGEYNVYVKPGKSHCTQETFNCRQQ